MNSRQRKQPAKAPADAARDHIIIYGWHSAVAALANPARRIHRVLATRNALRRLAEHGIADLPEPVEARAIDRLVGGDAVHQGIAVICDRLPSRHLDDLDDARLVVVLDQVTDPHNVGAVLRSAAAFGADAVVLTERHGPSDSGVLAKAACGALEHVALMRVTNLARAMDQLGAMGFYRIGLDSGYDTDLAESPPSDKMVLALGAEDKGLRRLTREACDRRAAIAMPGPIKSLNVSNAAALALYVLTRRAAATARSS